MHQLWLIEGDEVSKSIMLINNVYGNVEKMKIAF